MTSYSEGRGGRGSSFLGQNVTGGRGEGVDPNVTSHLDVDKIDLVIWESVTFTDRVPYISKLTRIYFLVT